LKKFIFNHKDAIARSTLKKKLKDIFILHGAIDIDLPLLAPVQDSFTLLLSLR